MIADKSFHAAGIDHDRGPAAFGKTTGHEGERGLGQVFQRRAANQTESMTNRVEYFVRAGERTRMRDRLALAHFRAAKLDSENRLPFVERLLGDGHEFIRSTNA